ncbi:MAG TPA: NAD(P)-dependent oxidoreductase [Ferruginibacter sp.]|jgi:nucleoside-diphosphate-sugar epimerase|nr:NAD(P)-dependent oxidoreductase [Ferruginibacter sp.]
MFAEYNKFIKSDCIQSINGIEENMHALKNKHILITGGTGFMGSWLTAFILFLNKEYNYNVRLTLLSRNASESHINKWNDKINFIDADVRNLTDLPKDINYLIHAAASPDITFHSSQPLKTYESIVNGTFNVFNAAAMVDDLQNIVHVSSGLVYGKNESGIYDEFSFGSFNCNSINSIYTESKRMAETIAATCRNQFRLPISIVRPFTFIGPFQSLQKTWAFNSIVRDALLNNEIKILGDGKIKRGYMYGSDMAAWLLCILANPSTENVFNLGSSTVSSLAEIASIVSSTLPGKPEINYSNFTANLPNNNDFIPDTDKAKKMYGVKEQISLKMAIEKTLNWYSNK